MSIPRSKRIVRWPAKGHPGDNKPLPMGVYTAGLQDEKFQHLLGEFAAEWPHVESAMVWVFAVIIGISDYRMATPIFRSIINQKTRIDIMTNLLEQSATHVTFDKWYDEVIDEFKSVNRSRNKYIHSLWWTHDDGKVFLQEDMLNPRIMGNPREITLNELSNVVRRMRALLEKIHTRSFANDEDRAAIIAANTLPARR